MPENTPLNQRLINAYNNMLEHLRIGPPDLDENQPSPDLQHRLDKAMEKVSEIEQLGTNEAKTITGYLKRDIEAAAHWLANEGEDLKDWFRFDIEQAESKLIEHFSIVADQTTLELKKLRQQADVIGEWHTGEITGVGTLRCSECNKDIHFHTTGHIPPCPQCHGTVFKRITDA